MWMGRLRSAARPSHCSKAAYGSRARCRVLTAASCYPVPAGTYDLVVTSSGRATAVMTGVPDTTTTVTTVNALATAISPPALTQRTRAVASNVSPATATVRAVQALSGGPTVETHRHRSTPHPVTSHLRCRSIRRCAPPTRLILTPDALALGPYTIKARSESGSRARTSRPCPPRDPRSRPRQGRARRGAKGPDGVADHREP